MNTFKKIVALGFFIGVLAVAVAAVTVAQQRGGRDRMPGRMPQDNQQPDDQMQPRCREFMQRRRQMLDEIAAMEQRLMEMVETLNTAADEQARMDALVALVNELADQHIEMFRKIQRMHEDGMRHTGMHMRYGPRSMMGCPMMSDDMDGAGDTSP